MAATHQSEGGQTGPLNLVDENHLRTFYLVFSGMFTLLFLSVVLTAMYAAGTGDPFGTVIGATLATVCGRLAIRAAEYIQE